MTRSCNSQGPSFLADQLLGGEEGALLVFGEPGTDAIPEGPVGKVGDSGCGGDGKGRRSKTKLPGWFGLIGRAPLWEWVKNWLDKVDLQA